MEQLLILFLAAQRLSHQVSAAITQLQVQAAKVVFQVIRLLPALLFTRRQALVFLARAFVLVMHIH